MFCNKHKYRCSRRKGFGEAHRVPHGCHGLPASFTSPSFKILRDSCNRVREPIRIFIDSIPPPSPPPEICDEIGELQIGGGEQPEEETEEMKDETPASRNHRHRPWARKVISAHLKTRGQWPCRASGLLHRQNRDQGWSLDGL